MKKAIIIIILLLMVNMMALADVNLPIKKDYDPILKADELPGFKLIRAVDYGKIDLQKYVREKNINTKVTTTNGRQIREKWSTINPWDLKKTKEEYGTIPVYKTIIINRYFLKTSEDAWVFWKNVPMGFYTAIDGIPFFQKGSYSGEKFGDDCWSRKEPEGKNITEFLKLHPGFFNKCRGMVFIKNNIIISIRVSKNSQDPNNGVDPFFVEKIARIVEERTFQGKSLAIPPKKIVEKVKK